VSAECPNCGQSWGAEEALSNSEHHAAELEAEIGAYGHTMLEQSEHIAELEAKVARLTARGIEDMLHRIVELETDIADIAKALGCDHPTADSIHEWISAWAEQSAAEHARVADLEARLRAVENG
jgi:type I site-specific restriction endonuclease